MTRSSLTVLAGLLAATTLRAVAGELSPQDFAYEVPLTTPGSAAAYRVPIPLEVYRHVAHEDLRDVRVFNARGEVVPYELETPEPQPAARPQGRSLALFPLRGEARVALDGLRISVQSQGTAVNVQTAGPQASGSTGRPGTTDHRARVASATGRLRSELERAVARREDGGGSRARHW